jgi:hypothetical protein
MKCPKCKAHFKAREAKSWHGSIGLLWAWEIREYFLCPPAPPGPHGRGLFHTGPSGLRFSPDQGPREGRPN